MNFLRDKNMSKILISNYLRAPMLKIIEIITLKWSKNNQYPKKIKQNKKWKIMQIKINPCPMKSIPITYKKRIVKLKINRIIKNR